MDLSKFKDVFISEARDSLEKLNKDLLAFEKGRDANLLNDLMRYAHTIKGSSATMGYKKTSELTHVLEDVFDLARKGKFEIEDDMFDKLFDVFDALEDSIDSIEKTDEELDSSELIEEMRELTGIELDHSVHEKHDIKDVKQGEIAEKKESVEVAEEVSSEENGEMAKISSVKVPVERLDGLMDLTEELLVNKMQMENLTDEHENAELKSAVEQMSRLVSDLQFHVMQARLVPVEQVFVRFPRMVRDLSKNQGKDVELQIEGGDLELDRTVVDKLASPVMHLLRNAVDHGIADKGSVRLVATREKDGVTIVVEDDGSGVDWAKVVDSAVRKGILPEERGEALRHGVSNFKDKQLLDHLKKIEPLLYDPRLSTREQVTEISGRGVGLNVVKEFMDDIGGSINLISVPGAGGTKFILEMPLTLAIIDSLLVDVGGIPFAIPFANVERTVHVEPENMKSIGGQDMAIVDGKNIPLLYLSDVYKFSKSEDAVNPKRKTVVMIRKKDCCAGLVVDKMLDEQEIIVKPLPSVLSGIKGFAGSTILGDGKSILIIDAATLMDFVSDNS